MIFKTNIFNTAVPSSTNQTTVEDLSNFKLESDKIPST